MPIIVAPRNQEPVRTESSEPQDMSPETLDSGLNLENLEILSYLGMKEEMFNEEALEKVESIKDYLALVEKDIIDIDLELGNPGNMTRLDKIYSYVLLEKQSEEILNREKNINAQKLRYKLIG